MHRSLAHTGCVCIFFSWALENQFSTIRALSRILNIKLLHQQQAVTVKNERRGILFDIYIHFHDGFDRVFCHIQCCDLMLSLSLSFLLRSCGLCILSFFVTYIQHSFTIFIILLTHWKMNMRRKWFATDRACAFLFRFSDECDSQWRKKKQTAKHTIF